MDLQQLDDLRSTLRQTGVGIWAFDLATGVFQLDDTCREIFELPAGAPMGKDVMARKIHPDDLDRYYAEAKRSMAGGETSIEYRIVRDDGSVRFVSNKGRVRVRPGLPPLMTGIVVDVTERKNLEEELIATQARMQGLADNVPGLFAYLDRAYIVRFMSAQYDEWFGHSRARHLNRHIAEVIGAERFDKRRPLYDRALAGEVVAYEEERRMASGEVRHYALTYRPALSRSGEIVGILSLGIDITERRGIERRLEEKTAELERSNQDLEQFAYVASHDLKAPLRSIEILVDWIREDLGNVQQGEVQPNLVLLKQRTARLHRLLDDLLEYSRAGRKPGDVVPVDTRLLVRDLFVLLGPPPTMRLAADESLPKIVTHHAPLEQVLRNLINNAIKHHPRPDGWIRVSAQEKADEVLFAVEDDGVGIPAQFAEKVFQMFQTLRPRDEVEGSGMGLAIVKRIVEWQGGRIWFHAGPGGKGTVFKFTWKKRNPGELASGHEVAHERLEKREHSAG